MPAFISPTGIIAARRRPGFSRAAKGAGQSGFFLTVIFPHDQVQILPYNRRAKGYERPLAEQLAGKAGWSIHHPTAGTATPPANMNSGFILGPVAHPDFPSTIRRHPDPIEKLDVTLLQKYVLDPIFGIDDPRTSKRINFIGGIRGTGGTGKAREQRANTRAPFQCFQRASRI